MPTLTAISALLLQAIAAGRRYGFDLMDATGLPSGTVYPALRRLEREGWVRAGWEAAATAAREGRPRRRYYALTASGVEALAVVRQRFPFVHGFGAPLPSPS